MLDLSTLTEGEHTVYVSATDASGNTGVVSAATISGAVVDSITSAGVAATITAGPFQTTGDPATGVYTMLTTAGSYTVSVTPLSDDYTATSVAEVVATAGETTSLNFSLSSFCTVFSDDVESTDVAWTAQGSWARDDQFANSPTFSWTDSPGGDYVNNSNGLRHCEH